MCSTAARMARTATPAPMPHMPGWPATAPRMAGWLSTPPTARSPTPSSSRWAGGANTTTCRRCVAWCAAPPISSSPWPSASCLSRTPRAYSHPRCPRPGRRHRGARRRAARQHSITADLGLESRLLQAPFHLALHIAATGDLVRRARVVEQQPIAPDHPRQVVVEGLRIQFASGAEAGWVMQDRIEALVRQLRDALGDVPVDQLQP